MLVDVQKFHLYSEQNFRLFAKEITELNFSIFSPFKKDI